MKKKKILFVVVKLKNMIKKNYAELVEQTVTVAVQINLFYSIRFIVISINRYKNIPVGNKPEYFSLLAFFSFTIT